MKAKAILLASVLLVGCQSTGNVQQHAQSLSAAGQGEAAKFTSQARWMDDGTSIAPDGDLWAFIGDELKMGIPENDRIREQKQKYLRNKSYLHDVTLRAEPYMYWIAGQVKKRNMPMELVLLPIVESAFDPHATSGANAAGIWQIIPSTGRNYGLKQTRNYDARRDVVASTTAALNMMQRLNKMCLQLADGNPRHICNLRHFNRAAQVHTRQSTAFIGRWQTYAITLAVFENITQCQHFRHVLLRFLRQR